jgi:tetratricopeptide (TPR) repeat protein
MLVASVSALLLAFNAANGIAAAPPSPSPPALSPNEAQELLARALDYQRHLAYESAIGAYAEALRGSLSPKMRTIALYNRALAHQQAGHLSLAVEDFSSALLLNPTLAHAYYGRANAMRALGRHLGALGDYESAARYKYPELHLPLFGQALAYEQLNRPLSAERLLQSTLGVKSDFAPALQKLAEIRQGFTASIDSAAPRGAAIAVSVSTQSTYGHMTDRIDDIVVGSVSLVSPGQIIRKAAAPRPVRPPAHLLEAAEQVEVATMKLPGLHSLSVSRTPVALSPTFLIAEKKKFEKIQDRVPQETSDSLVATAYMHIEPVSAPVEFKTRSKPEPQPEAVGPADPPPVVTGYLVQVNSQRSEEAAWSAWKIFQKKHAKLLAAREAIVQKADLGQDGIVYRLRITGLATQSEAKTLCATLKSQGISCFVAKAGA